jgi:hypothetical protein
MFSILNNNSENIIKELESQNQLINNIHNSTNNINNNLSLSEQLLKYFKKINPFNFLFLDINSENNIIEIPKNNNKNEIENQLNNLKLLNININNILTEQNNSLDNINQNVENINSKIKYLNKRI